MAVAKRRAILVGALLTAAAAADARAEIAVFVGGTALKITGHREEGGMVFLTLKGGGEVGTSPSRIQGFVPDEVLDEVQEATSSTEAATPADLPQLAAVVARRHGLDPALVHSVISVESDFRPDAVSPKGAQGLMQLMPATAASLGVENPFDPASNLDGGVRHLGSLLATYRGDLRRALAAYNAGAGAVARYRGVPPYRETREYVDRVLRRYGKKR